MFFHHTVITVMCFKYVVVFPRCMEFWKFNVYTTNKYTVINIGKITEFSYINRSVVTSDILLRISICYHATGDIIEVLSRIPNGILV